MSADSSHRRPLDANAIAAALRSLPGWTHTQGQLYCEFKFRDFNEAFNFMTAVAKTADTMDHHPDWSNVYNSVKVKLCTHDTLPPGGGITSLDIDLARIMNDLTITK
ncbi:MAG: 4a-hydroxytetrahydrobiopterin dehydratase [Bdellovibrionales bacterium]|nr:4a-hydroxytetrahydrobiopterin dehydratase [Bdellovibrionales bacterium]